MAAHLTGLLLWAGGTLLAARLSLLRASGELFSPALDALERRALFMAGHGGMAVAILTGAAMLAFSPRYFLSQGWMTGKLAFAAAAVGATVGLTVLRRSPGKGRGVRRWRALLLLSLSGALLLACLRPL